jgi:hypothetical protein
MSVSSFRRILIIWWLVGVLCVVVNAATQTYLPAELAGYVAKNAAAEPTDFEFAGIILGLLLLLALGIGSIGLFFLRSWARDTFLLANVLGVFLTPFFGPSVMSEWASGVSYLSSILTGGILFVLYLSPLSQSFNRDAGVRG